MPTFKESGFPDLTLSEMFVFVARAQTPASVQKDLAAALSAAVRSKAVDEVLEKAEYDPLVMEPAAIVRRLQTEQQQRNRDLDPQVIWRGNDEQDGLWTNRRPAASR